VIHRIAMIAAMAGGAIAACSAWYYTLCLWSAANSCVSERQASCLSEVEVAPAPYTVSILKPLKGTDPKMLKASAAIAFRTIRI